MKKSKKQVNPSDNDWAVFLNGKKVDHEVLSSLQDRAKPDEQEVRCYENFLNE